MVCVYVWMVCLFMYGVSVCVMFVYGVCEWCVCNVCEWCVSNVCVYVCNVCV